MQYELIAQGRAGLYVYQGRGQWKFGGKGKPYSAPKAAKLAAILSHNEGLPVTWRARSRLLRLVAASQNIAGLVCCYWIARQAESALWHVIGWLS